MIVASLPYTCFVAMACIVFSLATKEELTGTCKDLETYVV